MQELPIVSLTTLILRAIPATTTATLLQPYHVRGPCFILEGALYYNAHSAKEIMKAHTSVWTGNTFQGPMP